MIFLIRQKMNPRAAKPPCNRLRALRLSNGQPKEIRKTANTRKWTRMQKEAPRIREHRGLIQRAIPACLEQETSFDVKSIGISVTADLPYSRLYEISRMARIERGLRSRSRRMENKESIPLSGTNSLMRVEKRKEELSQKRYSWTKMQSRTWESSSLRFRLDLMAERSRPARSTPTSAYSSGKFLLSCLPYLNVNL